MLGSPALFDRHVIFIFNVCVIIFLNCQAISSVDTVKKKEKKWCWFCKHFFSVCLRLPALLQKPLPEFQLCEGRDAYSVTVLCLQTAIA